MKRNVLNMAMAALLFVVMNYRFTENMVHELLGVLLSVFFFLHNRWNWDWYKALGKGRMTLHRLLFTGVNCLLIAAVLTALASGILISQSLLISFHFRAVLTIHEIHSVSAYLTFLLSAVHLGLHWETLLQRANARWGIALSGNNRTVIVFRIVALFVMGYGVYAFYEQQFASKIFMEHTSWLWDVAPSFGRFTFDYAAIFGLYAGVAHYISQGMKHMKCFVQASACKRFVR